MANSEKSITFGNLGTLSIESLDEAAAENFESLASRTIEELTDLNAYAIQSGCSACSASGMDCC